ncbi:MAG: hypothetical protein IKR49_02060 [Clostridia bacterium]|nr:hypothetical protein [Clostridia bacterium]
MASKEEKKASFILYHEHFELFAPLNQKQRGDLVTAIFEHECGGDIPKLDKQTKMAFISIRQDLVRNGKAYEERCRQNKENGKKGGRPTKKTERFFEKPNGFFENPNDNDNEHDSVHYSVERSGENAGLALPGETDEECKKRLEALRNQ